MFLCFCSLIFLNIYTHCSRIRLSKCWFHQFLFIIDDIRQFAIITAIDEIGVPNEDMENAYKYPCVRNIRDKVAETLDIVPGRVFPVSNYFVEYAANEVKNAMSLKALMYVCNSGEDYIKQKFENNIEPNFYPNSNWVRWSTVIGLRISCVVRKHVFFHFTFFLRSTRQIVIILGVKHVLGKRNFNCKIQG